MSQFAQIRIAAAIAAAALPLSSALADSMSMIASANITATCAMVSVGPMAFGTLNQVTAPAVPQTSTAVYKCTSGHTPTFDVGGEVDGTTTGFVGSLSNGTDTIGYTVKWATPGAATGLSTPVNVTLSGNIPAGTYGDKSAGGYTQTVAVTIAP